MLFGQNNSSEAFFTTEDMPLFGNGGIENFRKYVQDRIKYPEEAIILGIEGKIIIRFLINFSDVLPRGRGKTDSVHVVKSLHPLLDSVALNAIKSSPLWTSGKSRGMPDNVWIIIPVSFEMPGVKPDYEISRKDDPDNQRIQRCEPEREWNIHQTLINGLERIIKMAPVIEDSCDIYFKLNKQGYIIDYKILNYKSKCFEEFIETYMLSLPKISTKINNYISDDTWLKVSVGSNSSGLSLGKIRKADKTDLPEMVNTPITINCPMFDDIFNKFEKYDSMQIETVIESHGNIKHSITLYNSYPDYNIVQISSIKYENNERTESNTSFLYRDSENDQQQITNYLITCKKYVQDINVKKINKWFTKQKLPGNNFILTKIFTLTEDNEDTIKIYKYYSNLLSRNKWIDTWNSYTVTTNNRKLEEGFQITTGMETMAGDNQDVYRYYNNGSQIVCRIRRNEGSRTKVYFVEKNKRWVFRIEDVLDDFHALFSGEICIETFEDYLKMNHFEYYPSLQIFDNSNRLIKEKFFEKKYEEGTQIDRLIDYKYYKHNNEYIDNFSIQ